MAQAKCEVNRNNAEEFQRKDPKKQRRKEKNRILMQKHQSPSGDRAELHAVSHIPCVFAPLRLCVKTLTAQLFAGVTFAIASRKFSSRNGLLITKSTPVRGLPEPCSISA